MMEPANLALHLTPAASRLSGFTSHRSAWEVSWIVEAVENPYRTSEISSLFNGSAVVLVKRREIWRAIKNTLTIKARSRKRGHSAF